MKPRVLLVVGSQLGSHALVAGAVERGLVDEFDVRVALVRSLRPRDQVDALVLFSWQTLPIVRSIHPHVPIVLCLNDCYSWRSDLGAWRQMLSLSSVVVVNHPALVEVAAGPAPVFVCLDGVDLEAFALRQYFAGTHAAGWCGDSRVVLGVGVEDAKGVEIVRRSCALAGVEARVQDAAVARVAYAEMPEWHCRNSVYLVASEAETTPLSLLEALACGVPVISTRVGRATELIVDGVNGLLVDRSPEAFAQALVATRNWGSSRAHACRGSVLSCGWGAMAERWREPIRAALGSAAGDSVPAMSLLVVEPARSGVGSGGPRPALLSVELEEEVLATRCRVVCADNGAGLSRDRSILSEVLSEWEVEFCSPFDVPESWVPVQFFDEVVVPDALDRAAWNVLLPHPELWEPAWTSLLRRAGVVVWAKTRRTAEVFRGLGAQVVFSGWTSLDRLDSSVRREASFYHLGGSSLRKGTHDLIRYWKPSWPPIKVRVGPDVPLGAARNPNVHVERGVLSDADLRLEQNRHLFHVFPSRQEGYGHSVWEALSCGALVLGTDAPFLADAISGAGVPVSAEERSLDGQIVPDYVVSAAGMGKALSFVKESSEGSLLSLRSAARSRWEEADFTFRGGFSSRLEGLLSAPEHLVVCHSALHPCGIREYGRQLDAALEQAGVHPIALTFKDFAEVEAIASRYTTLLVHFEPALVPSGFREVLGRVRRKGARIVFCCHWFASDVPYIYGAEVDCFVVHRDYGEEERVEVIPLAAPTYDPPSDVAGLRRRLGLPQGAVVVTTLGFLSPWKSTARVLGALLRGGLSKDVFLQVLTPLPFSGDRTGEAAAVRSVLSEMDPSRFFFSTEFRSEADLLDRVRASDLGFVYHGQHTGSVSAATKQCVSARTPLVVTASSHSSDIAEGGVERVSTFDVDEFARSVLLLASDPDRRARMRLALEEEYSSRSMAVVARRYVDLFRRLRSREVVRGRKP